MQRLRGVLVGLAAFAAIGVVVYFLVASLGVRFGLVDWRVGFGQMTFQYGAVVLLAASAVCILALATALFVRPRRGVLVSLACLAVPLALFGYGLVVAAGARSVPPIHDVSTDPLDPPDFSAETVAAREAVPGVNGLDLAQKRIPQDARFGEMAGRRVTEVQQEAYPDLAPIRLSVPPQEAFARAEAVARGLGWTVERSDPATGRIEATQRSFWYGFTDDVAIRVRPAPEGALVDVRSVSRVGVSDLGVNAKRIRAFRAALLAET